MRKIICIISWCIWLTGTTATLHADTDSSHHTNAFVISLDVPEERAPEWLCVLTHVACRTEKNCPETAELSLIEDVLEDHGGGRYGFRSGPAQPPGKAAPGNIEAALRSLIRTPPAERVCSREDYAACSPEIDLRQFGWMTRARRSSTSPRFSGRIACGVRRDTQTSIGDHVGTDLEAPGAEGSFADKRVAFIALTFRDAFQDGLGIQGVKLVGTTATVLFENSLASSTAAVVQVVGGDYAASKASTFATSGNAIVKMTPRCNRFIAEVPAHVAPIESISLDSASLEAAAAREAGRARDTRHPSHADPLGRLRLHGPAQAHRGATCTPANTTSRAIAIELPVTPSGEEKLLTVSYATEPATTSEVRWTDPVPPAPLKLGVRSIEFRWRRPVGCLAERWSEPMPVIAETARSQWTRSCPQATLSATTICDVISRDPAENGGELDACEYHCQVEDRLEPRTLPVAVTFDRIRPNPTTQRPEIVYSWHDTLEYSGQELTSVVAPADRRVMLEFKDPSDWRDRDGDEIDAIEIVSGPSSNRLELRGRDKAEEPPRWVSLPTAGRTCTDRVRVAVIGTRRYDDTSFEVKNGRVELARPYEYRPHLLFYGLIGSGALFRSLTSNVTSKATSNVRSATFGDIGLGGQYDLGGPWSLDLELTGQLTHTFGFDPSGQSDVRAVSYLRFDARGALEWWHHRRFGAALGAGVGLGTPLAFADDRIVGDVQFSTLLEAQPLIFTMFPRRLWFLAGAGFRLLEQHVDRAMDSVGSPTSNLERDPQWYVFLRFRGALE